ncbi:hypothetical protein [Streptomyces turgidiscabies]|uniref:Antitoxin (DNA-binding transcriptional repressor) of toxin-antitoxin stability system n=1 Tax=Streptomyces turgidiscabies TaxID=85558 RepID=A0ABU0RZK0_9ACTN|nr:hypothetical protein [Streptomyces turgidiscabies]MDQ0937402.1 antitoxin (DNA-binding transcriptional repressor) of toxin-antitoxin stability system [Streptomyces turgidiscabies]
MTDHALRLLRQSRAAAELAAFPFEFDLDRADHGEEVRLASGDPLTPVAGDGTGGTYFVCADGSVLYADSEGSAGIIGSSADEALETVIGLPGWHDYLDLSPADGPEKILARVAETEEEIRADYDVDAERAGLRALLGLPERSPMELIGMLHTALLRTEPDFLLLNAQDGGAYARLDPHPRPPLWEPVLARGRADLAALRAGDRSTAWDAVARDPLRRRLALRAAQFDRADGDLGLLRHLVRYEAEASMTDELRLGAVLVGLHGRAEDLPLLHEVRDTDFDTACGLSELPRPGDTGAELRRWALETDASMFGTDPADEPAFTWTELARDQGMTELARVTLIRLLDEIELARHLLRRPGGAPEALDTSPLRALTRGFEELGDRFQALRAQRLFAALQDTAWARVSARLTQARLERELGRLPQAVATLAALRAVLTDPRDTSLRLWYGVNLGRYIAEEHYTLTRALADADLPGEARALLAASDAILGELSGNAATGVRELAEDTAERVRGLG